MCPDSLLPSQELLDGSISYPPTADFSITCVRPRCRAASLSYLVKEIPSSAASSPIVQQSKLSLATAAATAAGVLRQVEAHLASGPAGCRRSDPGGGIARRGVSNAERYQEIASQLEALQKAQELDVVLRWREVGQGPADQFPPKVE